jgi:hypothetical protein
MSVELIWDDAAQTTVRYQIEGYWVWDDIHEAVESARLMMAKVDHPISVIVDLTQSRTRPNFARWRGEQMSAETKTQIRLVVMVGDDSLGSLFDIFAPYLPPKARYAPTLEAARAMIAEVISTEP